MKSYRIFYTYPNETDERVVHRDDDDAFVNEAEDITEVSDLKVGDRIYVYSNLGTITRIEEESEPPCEHCGGTGVIRSGWLSGYGCSCSAGRALH